MSLFVVKHRAQMIIQEANGQANNTFLEVLKIDARLWVQKKNSLFKNNLTKLLFKNIFPNIIFDK